MRSELDTSRGQGISQDLETAWMPKIGNGKIVWRPVFQKETTIIYSL